MFLGRSKFPKQFLKRVTQGTFLWNYFKIGWGVSEEKIFKELLKNFNFVAMATRVFDGIKFCEQFLKRTSQGTFLPSMVQIGASVWEEKIFKEIVDDAWRHVTTIKAPLEHVVLRWAEKALSSKREKLPNVWKWVNLKKDIQISNMLPNDLSLSSIYAHFYTLKKQEGQFFFCCFHRRIYTNTMFTDRS